MREPTAPAYYDRRAPEYDDWYEGTGLFTARHRPGFADEVAEVAARLGALPPCFTLDVACGTGFLTRHLRGEVTGLDQSPRMLEVARAQAPTATLVQGDGLALPFGDDTFARVVTGHFYGHLDAHQRSTFLAEARRVAPELVVVDASATHADEVEGWAERTLNDGTRWEVFKRYFTAAQLVEELGGGEILFEGDWFVIVRSTR